MFMLRKIPKRTDSVKFSGFKFEVVDIDNYRIDALLVTHINNKPTVLVPKLPDAQEKMSNNAVPETSTAPIGSRFLLLHSTLVKPSRSAGAHNLTVDSDITE